MFERPILFYSDYCVHSKNFINILVKNQDIYKDFIRINIDVDPDTKTRPEILYNIQKQLNANITEVPTVITPGPEYILVGADAFSWLENIVNKTNNTESVSGFNSMEMGSFSDSYSTYGSSDLYDAKEQTFKFINKPEHRIETPPESIDNRQDKFGGKQHKFGGSEKQRDIDDRLQKLIAERESYCRSIERV